MTTPIEHVSALGVSNATAPDADAVASPATPAPDQVLASLSALQLIDKLRKRHGPVLFHQSGGCCDGSSPMCFPQDDFIVGDRDVQLGTIGDAPFYISEPQFQYWKHTQLIIDVVEGRGGMFSLENGEGVRFHVRSKLFTDDEYAALQAAGKV